VLAVVNEDCYFHNVHYYVLFVVLELLKIVSTYVSLKVSIGYDVFGIDYVGAWWSLRIVCYVFKSLMHFSLLSSDNNICIRFDLVIYCLKFIPFYYFYYLMCAYLVPEIY